MNPVKQSKMGETLPAPKSVSVYMEAGMAWSDFHCPDLLQDD